MKKGKKDKLENSCFWRCARLSTDVIHLETPETSQETEYDHVRLLIY